MLLVLASVPIASQQPERAEQLGRQIDRIFKDRAYDPSRFGPARWLPDGSAYAIVERPAGGGTEIARYDAVSGARTVSVGSAQLVPPGATTPLDIADYAWSADGKRLLIFTNTRKVWRQNTRGDYWVLDVDGGRLRKLGGPKAPEASLMFAKFSPSGERAAYVRGNNLYVETIDTGAVTQLSHDGTPPPSGAAWAAATAGTIVNGTSDWVNEEELNIRDGFRWSPDGRRLAYYQFDTHGVGNMTLVNDTDSQYPVATTFAYPKTGTSNSAVRVGVVAASGGATTWMKTPGDPRQTYLASLDWVDAATLAMQQLNRRQTQNDLLLADAATGAVRVAFSDRAVSDRAWVDVQSDITWLDEGKTFLWLSERDGWQHLYRVDRATGTPTLLSTTTADILDVAAVDTAHHTAYVLASPGRATERYLYRVPTDRAGDMTRVTPAGPPGWHSYTIAPRSALAFHTSASFDRPPAMEVVSLPAHEPKRQLTDPSALAARVGPILQPPVEFLTVGIGNGVALDGWLLKPADFDPARKYPVIVFVYGEPASQTVTQNWGGGRMLFHRALANAGYLVVSFDNRGTPSPKGSAWRKVVYGTVGDLSSKEQAAAIQQLASERSYIDRTRIGVWGWSGGGSNTLNCMFRFPDVYKVGVSVAPVPDQRLYDTIYQERYMSTPQDNAEGYSTGSPINFAQGLKGHLLIIHGSGDDNVHYQGTERLINRLVELGKPFDVMVYPNRTHSISEGLGTTEHVYQRIARFFLDHL